TASSSYGTVNFVITTIISPQGGLGASFNFVSPPQTNPNLTAASGTTLAAGVVDKVIAAYGNEANSPIPNVSVQIVNALDHSPSSVASCSAPLGTVFTDTTGTGTCNLL